MDGNRLCRYAGLICTTALLVAFPGVAQGATATTTGTVSAGSLSLTTSATPSFSATLDGTNQTPTYTVPSTAEDSRGSGAGWNLTVTSTQFSTGGMTPKTLSTSASSVTGVTNTCASGTTCTAATNGITYPLTVPAAASPPAAVKYYNAAADTGMGEFTNTPTVSVAVPANAYAGTYTSTLTLSAVSGP